MSPGVYRAPMRSRLDEVDAAATVARALHVGVCGLGGRLPVPPASLAEAVAATGDVHDLGAARRLRRFGEVPVGAEVWTRAPDGRFRLGTLTGDWWYDDSTAAWELDLVHVRACRWSPEEWSEDELPAPVAETFRRGGRNFQRIHRATPTLPEG